MNRCMWFPYRPWFVCLTLILLFYGCAGIQRRADSIRVSLAAIRILEVKGFETAFDVTLRVFNRGDQPLKLKGIDCQLQLDGKHLAEGVARIPGEIAAYSSDTVTLTVYSSVLDMFRSVQGIMRRAGAPGGDTKVQYAVKGHLDMGGDGLLGGRIPFRSKGMIKMDALTERR